MNIGMMWLDDNKDRSLEDKVIRAVEYYIGKYGRTPDICCVNDAAVDEELKLDRVVVRPVSHIRPMHFWVGMQSV